MALLAGIVALAANLLLLVSFKVALAAVAGLIVGTIVFFQPMLGYYLTVATLPLEAAGKVGNILPFMQISLTKLAGALTAAVWICHVLLKRNKVRWSPQVSMLFGFLLLCGVSLIGAEQWENGYQAWIRLFGTFLFYFLTVNMLNSVAAIRRALAVLAVSSVLTFGFAIAQRYISSLSFGMRWNMEAEDQQSFGVERQTLDPGSAAYVERSSGTSQHSIIMAINTAIIAPLLVFFFYSKKGVWIRALILAGLGVTMGAALVSFSRTGFLTWSLVLLVLILQRVIKITPILICGVVAVGLLALPFMPKAFWERVFNPTSYTLKKSESLRIRMDLWDAGWRLTKDHFLTGMGVGNTRMLGRYWDDPNNGHYMTVHNAYLQVAMETGIPAAILLIFFFIQTLRLLQRTSKMAKPVGYEQWLMTRVFQASMVALLFSGTALDFMNQSFKNAWLVMGCAVVLYREMQKEASSENTVTTTKAIS